MRYRKSQITDKEGRPVIISFFSSVPTGKRVYREHHHAECELSVMLSGSGTYTVKNKIYDFSAGDVFFFSGDEEHCITDIRSEFELLNIHFQPRILWANNDDLSLTNILYARNDKFENKIDPQNGTTQIIKNEIINIEREMRNKKSGYKTLAKYRLFSALAYIIRDFGYIDTQKAGRVFNGTTEPLVRALNYIDENLNSCITLCDIAKYAAMSPTYFSAMFKKLNGISPWEYITIKRIEKAIDLIKTTNLTKIEIAMRCGFNSSSNFYKAFLHVTGKKPGDYR